MYLRKYHPVQLRDRATVTVNPDYVAYNFGESKGLTFGRILIYPAQPMINWIVDHKKELKFQSRSKLYVAITRVRHSVGIVFDNKKGISVDGIQVFHPSEALADDLH